MRLFALVLASAGLCAASACSSFDASDSGDASDGGGASDGASSETSIVGPEAGADVTLVDAAPGAVLTVAQENARTAFVAIDGQFIYWWSVERSEVRKADKNNPGTVTTVVARPGQTVTALAVDSSGLYWLEAGPDAFEGGTSNRIMRLAPGASNAVPVYTQASGMQLLALDSTRVLSTTGVALVGATKAGDVVDISLSVSQDTFASDGTSAYCTYDGSIYRVDPSGGVAVVITGLGNPSQLTVESPTMYGLFPSDAGLTLFRASTTGVSQPPSAATPITDLPSGSLFLALDNLGVVVANAVDGTIFRVARTTGARTPVVSGLMAPNAVAADARGVYWTTDSGQVGWATR